jgi:hypothetical protein
MLHRRWLRHSPFVQCLGLWVLTAAICTGVIAPALGQSSAGGGGGSGSGGTASTVAVSNFPATQAVSLSSLPAFAAVPTFNLGTLNGAATDASVQQVRTTLGSPFQSGGSIGNTAFGISGTLPAFAATPTFNLGTLNGAATAANQTAEIAAIQGRTAWAIETSGGSLAASATFSGSSRNVGASPAPYTKFNVSCLSAQAGTCKIQGANDGTNFLDVSSAAVSAGTATALSVPVVFQYYRAALVNGATATTLYVNSSYTAN